MVLSLHHRPQPDQRGVHRHGRHRAGGAPGEPRVGPDEDPGGGRGSPEEIESLGLQAASQGGEEEEERLRHQHR